MKITIRQLESFQAIAALGNFSRAAKAMNVAQPALSQAIKDLEEELSVRLFDRTTRRVELTEAGREFHASTAKLLEELQHAVQNVHDFANRRRGRIRIAVPPLLASVVLPRAISEFASRYPGVTIDLADVGTEQIVERVRSGAADCGVGTFHPNEHGLERIPLVRDSLMLFCSTNHNFARRPSVTWKEFVAEPLIALTRDSGIRLLVELGFESSELPFNPSYEVSQITTALALVQTRIGVAVLPAYALAAARYHRLVGIPIVEPTISRELVFVHASGRSLSPAASEFASVLRSHTRHLAAEIELIHDNSQPTS